MGLRAHDRQQPRERVVPTCLRLGHKLLQPRQPLGAGPRVVDVAETKHHRRQLEEAGGVALGIRRAGPGRQVGVTRAVDEPAAAHGPAAGLALHEQRLDGAVGHNGAHGQGMEQQLDASAERQLVGGALVGPDVIALDVDAAGEGLRLVQAAGGRDALEQLVGDAAHHPPRLAVDVRE